MKKTFLSLFCITLGLYLIGPKPTSNFKIRFPELPEELDTFLNKKDQLLAEFKTDIVDRYTNMADKGMKMIVGMSLGYAEPEDQKNSFYSSRVPLEDVMQVL